MFLLAAGALSAAVLLPACFTGGGGGSAVSNTPARTPTPAARPSATVDGASKAGGSTDPRAKYLVIKQSLTRLVPEPEEFYGGQVDIQDCDTGGDTLGVPHNDPVAPLADLAYEVIFIGKALNKAGYPPAVWRGPLEQFEREQLALRVGRPGYIPDIEDGRYRAGRERIVRAANEYREQAGGDLPEVIEEGGCGAGEVGVYVAAEPSDGRVNLIPVFFYELCRAEQSNPDDPAQCGRWREAVRGVLVNVSGDYVYRASWPDGAEKDGRVSFTKVEEGQTVIFRKH